MPMKEILRAVKAYLKQTDLFLLITALIATAYGILLIYSATLSYNSTAFVKVQLLAAMIGVIAFVICSLIDLDLFARYWKVLCFEHSANLLSVGFR